MAYCAAQNRTNKDIQLLERLMSETDDKSMGERDMRLHSIIARASGNVLYVVLLNAFTSHMDEYYALYFSNPENRAITPAFHKDIYEAIKNKNAAKSKNIMKDILQSAGKRMLRMLA